MAFSTAQDVYDQARPWQYRVVRASHSTTTGLIVLAILAKQRKVGPVFGRNCEILFDGKVVTPVRRHGVWGKPEVIGTTISVRDNLRTLADHCKLSDKEREELFDQLRKWIYKDHRAKSEI